MNYKFHNNGFRELRYPLTGMTIALLFFFTIIFFGMWATEFDFITSIKVYLIIPPVLLFVTFIFTIHYISIYFSLEITGSTLNIRTLRKRYSFSIYNIEDIKITRDDLSNKVLLIKTESEEVRLKLLSPKGFPIYDELFDEFRKLGFMKKED